MPLHSRRLIGFLLIVLGGLASGLCAAEAPATVVAVKVQGTVEVQHDGATATEAVVEGTQLVTADTITTAAKSSVMLVLPNGSVVSLREKSRLKIAVALHSPAAVEALAANEAEPRESGTSQTSFELAFGQMLTRVRKLNPTSTFTVQTPVSVAAVRGTVFEVSFDPGAKGEAHYNLSTSSGLVHVTPHGGKAVAVPDNRQVDFAAEVGKSGIKIKNLKASKLARQKQQQIEKEAVDNDHSAGEFMRRAQASAKTQARDQAAGNTPGTAADKAKAGAAPAVTHDGGDRTGGPPPAAPGSNATTSTNRSTTMAPSNPATPAPPAVKPKVPVPPKRPPRRT